ISLESFVFPIVLIGIFVLFAGIMGLANALNTMMNTAYSLLIDTVLYITAICVLMGALSELLSEFGFVVLVNKLLSPLMKPLYNLPGVAALGIITAFLSDNPAVLVLSENHHFRKYFKKYQLPALTNLGTSFGMGLIVCTYIYSLSAVMDQSLGKAIVIGLIGAGIGSVISVRMMLHFSRKYFKEEADEYLEATQEENAPVYMRLVRTGGISSRAISALLEGGKSGVRLGVSTIPGVLIVCTFVLMLINGPSANGSYTGAAYEGIRLLPYVANKLDFIINPLFGFSTPEAIGVPVTSLGAAGASISLINNLVSLGLVNQNDIAVFTAMCVCWSGFLSTHASMLDSMNYNELIGKATLSHAIGGFLAGVFAHLLFMIVG
ncbi:MAG: hypothetical protein IKS69_06905, partial [Erysipelotrichaceae bacterium]|nr:hypothetical protein [Erysipelotrichaceae bacterium]